jgi:hypothetical protein
VRPVRLAFLVDKPDAITLDQVFRLNTLIWGGLFNPVVILDGSTRKEVGRYYAYETSNYEEEVDLLLREFDPDVVINYSNVQLPPSFAPFKQRTFSRDAIRWNPWGNQEVMFFLEVWPFLHRYWRQEFRFLQKPGEAYGYIDLAPAGQFKTYLVARYGSYPEGNDGNGVLERNFAAKVVQYDESFRTSFTPSEWVFPISITGFGLNVPGPSTLNNYVFFLLDPENMFDIVDFWNLRAAGFRVFALPLGHYQDFAKAAKLFAERSVYPINKDVTTFPEVVKARSVDDAQLEDAAKWIGSLGVKAEMISRRGWVPRFGRRDARVWPEVQVRPVTSNESSEIVVLNDGSGTLKSPLPDCELGGPASSQHWAIDLRFLGSVGEDGTFRLPWLHAECDALANRKIGHGHGPTSSRVCKQGVVVIQRGDDENVWIQVPKVTDVLQALLKDAGFKYLKTSPPGLALERIIEQLGGVPAGILFQNPGVREVIVELANGSYMHAERVRSVIHKNLSAPENERQRTFEAILGQLVSRRILRQGLRFQCEKCQRHDWYPLGDVGEDFKCKKCFHLQRVPVLDKRPWYYVSDGLFRLEGKTAGCLTTLLSLVFLEMFLPHEMKYSSSFEYLDGTDAAERDFAILASEFMRDDVDVIIGECKTSGELQEKEKRDLRALAERTGAYLAFATLLDEFTKDDKTFFEELVASRKRPILLTRKHMEMSYEEVLDYRHRKRWMGGDTELLSRLTIREVLGDEFVDNHRLWA